MEEKISIIIPTLLKTERVLYKLVESLDNDSSTDEILIINNSKKKIKITSDKLKILSFNQNIYVNNSWNIGVKEAKNKYIGILNDDIIIPENFCRKILDFIQKTPNIGLVGLDSNTDLNKKNSNISEDLIFEKLDKYYEVNYWGSAFFGKKDNYYFIPEEMKIWCGDNYLLKMNMDNDYQNYQILNNNVIHIARTTSSLSDFDNIKINDCHIMQELFEDFPADKCISSVLNKNNPKKGLIKILNKYFFKFFE